MRISTVLDNKKLIIYAVLIIVVVFFSIYFFGRSNDADTISDPSVVQVPAQQGSILGANDEIDLNFFQSDKFRNLRFDKMPSVIFPVGKRDPFIPME